jgi:hypothetical protein
MTRFSTEIRLLLAVVNVFGATAVMAEGITS